MLIGFLLLPAIGNQGGKLHQNRFFGFELAIAEFMKRRCLEQRGISDDLLRREQVRIFLV